MKLDLRENMYIRTKDGIIAKVDYIDDNTIFFDKDLYRTYSDGINFLEKDNLERIVKASYNIIDILEIGDYVNGNKIGYIDDCEGTMREFYYDYENPNEDVGHWQEEINSVTTHEQMEQMAYKVEE